MNKRNQKRTTFQKINKNASDSKDKIKFKTNKVNEQQTNQPIENKIQRNKNKRSNQGHKKIKEAISTRKNKNAAKNKKSIRKGLGNKISGRMGPRPTNKHKIAANN